MFTNFKLEHIPGAQCDRHFNSRFSKSKSESEDSLSFEFPFVKQ